MIDLHFHWALIPMVLIIIFGICCAYRMSDNDRMGVGAAIGCSVFVACVLVALVLGGIFIW